MESKNHVQISLKLMTGETEVVTMKEDKEEITKFLSTIQGGGWVTVHDNGKLRMVNGQYVEKITVKATENSVYAREVIRK